jgi:integrase/recombinase XerC
MTNATIRTMSDLIDAHLAHLRAGGKATTTITKRGELLRRVDRDLPLGIDRCTVEELAGWLARDEWSPAAKHNYYWHLRGYFRWATDERNPHLDWDPSASLAKPKVPPSLPKPVTDAELEAALTRSDELWRRLIMLAAYGGLRCCELATIRREHVGEQDTIITGKGGKSRKVPTLPNVWAEIKDLPRGPLGPGDSNWVSRNALYHFARIGLDGVTMHRFRHWYATTALQNGVDLLTLSKLLGHAKTETTAVYCLISDEQRRTVVAALPVILGAPLTA